jgi:hypothetical protein
MRDKFSTFKRLMVKRLKVLASEEATGRGGGRDGAEIAFFLLKTNGYQSRAHVGRESPC